MSLKTPVVLIIFNRPDTTSKVFEAIRQAKPSLLLVIADGPRSDRLNETEKCSRVRDIIKTVDWKCKVLTNYSDTNLGCKNRVSSGLNWVFDIVEEAIILEDDCLPHSSFFPFCEELLARYRHEERIASISGQNVQLTQDNTGYSYYFSRYPHIWGWATWRRAWKNFDIEMKQWALVKNTKWLNSVLNNRLSAYYWKKKFDGCYTGNIKTVWDYQWTFACWRQNQLGITSSVNLITNIGYIEESTHTSDINSNYANLSYEQMSFPLRHPPQVTRNIKADYITEKKFFNLNLISMVKGKSKKILRDVSTLFFRRKL